MVISNSLVVVLYQWEFNILVPCLLPVTLLGRAPLLFVAFVLFGSLGMGAIVLSILLLRLRCFVLLWRFLLLLCILLFEFYQYILLRALDVVTVVVRGVLLSLSFSVFLGTFLPSFDRKGKVLVVFSRVRLILGPGVGYLCGRCKSLCLSLFGSHGHLFTSEFFLVRL